MREEIRRRVERLREGSTLLVSGIELSSHDLVPAIYETRGFEPLWTDPGAAADLVRALETLESHGLDPDDYGIAALRDAGMNARDAAASAEADLLRTHALVAAARGLRFGRVDPSGLEPSWQLAGPRGSLEPADLIAMVESGRIATGLDSLAPSHFTYTGLQAALERLRRVRDAGGWPRVPDGPVLALDSAGPRVAILRRHLILAGDLPDTTSAAETVFDATLDAAVRRFQHRHGLNEDGVVGRATLAALNVPVEQRIDLVRINLERGRWILQDLAPSFIAVNIAGQRAYYLRDGDVVWETRVIVGREYTRTPIFTDSMRYIVLNPTWTVPRSINGEILAAMRRNPSYLRQQNITILDGSGRPVDPSSIDPSAWSGRSFPYTFRQEPGPLNALGRIKFMLPNRYNVYLHDTPARTLFERETRTFSHGCIRVQDPLTLAELLLEDTSEWTRARLEAALETGRTQTIHLSSPLPTLILYWTAATDLHGELHFYRDIYGRDDRLLRELVNPPREMAIRRTPGVPDA